MCLVWQSGLDRGTGSWPAGNLERDLLGSAGYGTRSWDVIINAANNHLCPGRRDQAYRMYNEQPSSGYGDYDIEPPPDGGYEYQWGD